MRTISLSLAVLFAASLRVAAAEPPKEKEPVDKAIDNALAFLAATQDKTDGSWKHGNQRTPAATSLAVMAFLSAGHVPGEGKYGAAIEKGIRWVLSQQQPNGLITNDNSLEMYQHGISTLMLAEVAGMCDEELGKEVRKKLEKAVAVILKAQRPGGDERGGWRYNVQHVGGSDMSVTGWQVMALRGCKNLGCDVPAERISDAVEYIKRSQDPQTGGFRYTPREGVTVACTGTGILALELCGKDQHHSKEALKAGYYLIKKENLPAWNGQHFFYSIYYCSQATFQLGDNYWSVFKPKMHEVLLRNQKANGSWLGDGYDASFGPNYCTAMAVLALTVEYRYLPIYQRSEEPAESK